MSEEKNPDETATVARSQALAMTFSQAPLTWSNLAKGVGAQRNRSSRLHVATEGVNLATCSRVDASATAPSRTVADGPPGRPTH